LLIPTVFFANLPAKSSTSLQAWSRQDLIRSLLPFLPWQSPKWHPKLSHCGDKWVIVDHFGKDVAVGGALTTVKSTPLIYW